MKRLLGCVVVVAVIAAVSIVLLASSEGTTKDENVHYPQLVRSFGTGGYVALPTQLPGPARKTQLEHLAAAPDGAVYLTGLSSSGTCDRASEVCRSPGYLARVDSDGSIAATFGGSGRVEIGKAVEQMSPPLSDSEGRALIASQEGSSVTVHRYLADGAVDTSFGTDGTTTFDCGCGASGYRKLLLAIDHEERIVISIITASTGTLPSETLARLLPSGEMDGGFGAGGVLQLGGASLPMPPMGVAFGSDDSIYTWTADCCQVDSLFFLHRVSASGQIDSTFDARADDALIDIATRGAKRGFLSYSNMTLIVRPSGSLDLLGGGWMVRMRADGSAETNFAEGGIRQLAWTVLAPTLVSDGKVLALGSRPGGVTLIRLNRNGKPDRSFGKRGAVPIDGVELEGFYADEGLGLARLRDGRAQVLDVSDLSCTATCRAHPRPKLVRYRVGPDDQSPR